MDRKEIAQDMIVCMFVAFFVIACFYGIRALGGRMGMSVYPAETVPQWLTVPSGRLPIHLYDSLYETITVYFLYLGLPMLFAHIMGSAFGINEKMARTIMGVIFLTYILYIVLVKYDPTQVPIIYMFAMALFELILGLEYIFFWKSDSLLGIIQATIYLAITNLILYSCGFILKSFGFV